MEVIPFCAVRPESDKVHLVATRSYVSYTPSQLRSKLNENPFSFLHIIHPDYSKGKLHSTKKLAERFQKVRARYLQFLDEGILHRDTTPCYYVYRQTHSKHSFTGVIGAVSIQDYNEGKIKKHELTIAKRESTFTQYLDVTGINVEPVLLFNQNTDTVEEILGRTVLTAPVYKFTTTDKKLHEIWRIESKAVIDELKIEFGKSDRFYIADGHHRCSSSANLEAKRKAELGGTGPWNHCLALILDENQVKIHEFNRIVNDLGEHTPESFLASLTSDFFIEPILPHDTKTRERSCKMYLQKSWYRIWPKSINNVLITEFLSQNILSKILGIHDLRKDKRIQFSEGPKGIDYIRKKVDQNKGGVGFVMPPITIQELKRTADLGLAMPPKSTWIEPKLRSGLIVYEL